MFGATEPSSSHLRRVGLAWVLTALASVLPGTTGETAKPHEHERNLLLLSNGSIELGILPQAGGRVVLLRLAGGQNILRSDPTLWLPLEQTPIPLPTSDYIGYEGYEVWVGPQAAWWVQQKENTERADQAANWPPDPWITMGRFEVVSSTGESVTLRGPVSPVTGLRMTREIQLIGNSVRLTTTARNMRATPVSWDLWSLLRLPASAAVYAPVKRSWSSLRMEIGGMLERVAPVPYQVRDGLFSFDRRISFPEEKDSCNSKAYLKPSASWIAAFHSGVCLVTQTQPVPESRIHPTQAHVEIYVEHSRAPKKELLELEFHGAYEELASGEEMTRLETWTVMPWEGPDTPEAHREFLQKQMLSQPSINP